VRQAILATQNDGAAFVDRKRFESASEIMSESGIDGLRIVFGFELSFIDANELLSFSRFLTKTIVGDPVKPAEAPEIFVGFKKSFLRQIIGERDIGPDQIAKQTSHTRLVIPDQLRKSVVVVIKKNACNEVSIG